jgi:hypothetical protein
MKKLLLLPILAVMFTACDHPDHPGRTSINLTGEEPGLPPELKGLKVYTVADGNTGYVKVAVLNGQVNSTTWSEGKYTQSAIMVNTKHSRVIEIESVLMENDSVIMCKKVKQ